MTADSNPGPEIRAFILPMYGWGASLEVWENSVDMLVQDLDKNPDVNNHAAFDVVLRALLDDAFLSIGPQVKDMSAKALETISVNLHHLAAGIVVAARAKADERQRD